jgi:MFS superfamily sulfate permease-like transporter
VFELVRDQGLSALGPILRLAGLIQVVAGVFKLGGWFRAISPAVVHGMLAGIGVLIVVGQFHVLFDAKPLASGLENLAAMPAACSACRHEASPPPKSPSRRPADDRVMLGGRNSARSRCGSSPAR